MTGGMCPDENALVRFSMGQLSGADLGSVEQHVDGCSACRTLIVQLASLHSKTLETHAGAAQERAPALQGKVGRYQVERLLGGGGMGMVYAARDRELNRVVAIKVLKTSVAGGNSEPRARLLREAQTMAKLSHPNLVPIFELGNDRGDDFLAMELIDGPTLDFWLREKKRDWREVVAVFLDAGRGLEAAHQAGVVHRDFKPTNVLIGPDGRARVTDFGLARPRVPEPSEALDGASIELTREGSLLGTPAYMSPEQLEGQVADVRSDQFSFCVALVEALVGHRPFAGRTPGELRAGMRAGKPPEFDLEPARLKRALMRGMSLSPDARFPSISALLEELAAILEPTRRPAAALATAFAVGAVVIAGVTALTWERAPAPAPAPVAAAPQARSVALTVGETQVLALPAVQRIQSVDAAILDVKLIGNQQVSITALAPGHTALVLLTRASPHEEQQPVTWDVVVADDGGRNFMIQPGEKRSLNVPGLDHIDNQTQTIANARITGKDEVTVEGLAAGVTVLKTFVQGRAQPLTWRIEVADPRSVRMPLALVKGESRVIEVPDFSRLAVGDGAVADAKALGNSQVRVTGLEPGRTTLIVWTRAQPPKDEGRQEWDITVDPATELVTMAPRTQKVLTVVGLQRIAVGDVSIADVKTIGNNQVLVIAGEEGRTTLQGWLEGGKRVSWVIVVKSKKAAVAPPAEPLEATMTIPVGTQKVVTVPDIQRVAVGDSAILDVKTIGNNQLLLIGAGEGRTTLLIWKSDGTRLSSLVTVTPEPRPERKELELFVGGQKVIDLKDIRRVAVGESKVMDVKTIGTSQVLTIGVAEGRTTLLVWTADGKRHEWDVKVRP